MFTVYAYQNCDTCRKAIKWLKAHGVSHQVKAIRETPPTAAELRVALDSVGGETGRLFNTSGTDYRALGIKDKLPTLGEDDVIRLLTENGNLVKRPFLTGDGKTLVGFNPELWEKVLRDG